ncbi:hypothetical protein [Streptomyces sp. NBC_01304]|uniref:hypothetical protein n=1 Tax=Streptomyces sp. NBC_01304 TaxID=2903818 RepID=UPI002E103C1E|nr:hypothetical protein OG430_48235 [Streptomyces sp. NBC_01304]
MALRQSISQDELRKGMSDADQLRHATIRDPERGGWYPTGSPQDNQTQSKGK